MNKTKCLVDQIKIGLLIGLLASLTGCATYGGGPYYDGGVVVAEPDEYLFGGSYDNGRDVHNYSHRGSASRGAAHAGGGGHAGGRGGGRR
jgi:hypothetical protein